MKLVLEFNKRPILSKQTKEFATFQEFETKFLGELV